MRKHLIHLLFICFTALSVACSNDDDITIDSQDTTAVSLSAQTLMANQMNCGLVTADSEAVYFYDFDSEGIKLYSKNIASGALTVLDEMTAVEDGEVLYSEILPYGDYLYYMPFDSSDANKTARIWRMKKDGTDKQQINSEYTTEYQIYNDRIYFTTLLGSEYYSMNLDGSDVQTVLDFCPSFPWIKDDVLYYYDYANDESFTTQLCAIDLDGESEAELIYEAYAMTYTITDNGDIYCIDMSTSSPYSLVRIDATTKEAETLITGVADGMLNSYNNKIYLSVATYKDSYEGGIYSYEYGDEDLTFMGSVSTFYIFVIGQDQVAYANFFDQENAGRFWNLYLLNGDTNEKLIDAK